MNPVPKDSRFVLPSPRSRLRLALQRSCDGLARSPRSVHPRHSRVFRGVPQQPPSHRRLLRPVRRRRMFAQRSGRESRSKTPTGVIVSFPPADVRSHNATRRAQSTARPTTVRWSPATGQPPGSVTGGSVQTGRWYRAVSQLDYPLRLVMFPNQRMEVFTGVDKGNEIVRKPRRWSRSVSSLVENRSGQRLKATTARLGLLAQSFLGLGREVANGDAGHGLTGINRLVEMIACNHSIGKVPRAACARGLHRRTPRKCQSRHRIRDGWDG